jgi:hypothetical protein
MQIERSGYTLQNFPQKTYFFGQEKLYVNWLLASQNVSPIAYSLNQEFYVTRQ